MTVVNIGRKHTFRLYGILAGKAGGAETAFCVFGKLDNVLVGQIAQRIGADDLVDLLQRAAGLLRIIAASTY